MGLQPTVHVGCNTNAGLCKNTQQQLQQSRTLTAYTTIEDT